MKRSAPPSLVLAVLFTLALAGNASAGPVLQVLSGTYVIAAGTTWSLGSTNVSKSFNFTPQNIGNTTLNRTAATQVVGTGFSLFSDFGSLTAGNSGLFIISFNSAVGVGTWTADVTITTNAPGSPFKFKVTVEVTSGTQSRIIVRKPDGTEVPTGTSGMTFAPTLVQDSAAAQSVTVGNIGSASATVTGITIDDLANWAVSSVPAVPPSFAIPVGGTPATVSVTFKPVTGGAKSATVTIAYTDPVVRTCTFTVSGTALAPLMSVSQGSTPVGNGGTFTFPATLYNDTSSRDFTLTNSGDGELRLSGTPRVVLGGSNADQFSVTLQPTTPIPSSGASGSSPSSSLPPARVPRPRQ